MEPSDSTVSELSKEFTIQNSSGLHARPAAMFVKLANQFDSEVWVSKEGDDPINGKSIMGLMMLAAGPGTKITVTAEGSDAQASLDAIGALIEGNFEDA